MERRIPPSARIEADIEALLLAGTDQPDRLSELGRLGAQLILQRAVEDEVTAFLGRARYERTPDATGSRNGSRPRRVQTAEGEIVIAVPQVRDSLTRFVSSVIPEMRGIVRTRPLEALVIGAYVRGLSDRDIESLAREAGLGSISRTTVSTICRELRDRYRAFRARSLAEVRLLALFTDAIYLPVRPEGPREGVLVAWGYTSDGGRVLLDVCLGQRERTEDWLDLGRGLIRRGLRAPSAGGQRRRARPCHGHHRAVARRGPPALLGPPPAQRPGQAPGATRAPCPGAGRLLGGARRGRQPPGGGDRTAGPRGRARTGVPQCGGLSGRRPGGAHGPPRLPPPAAHEAALDEPAGALARGGPAADQGHRALPRRDAAA